MRDFNPWIAWISGGSFLLMLILYRIYTRRLAQTQQLLIQLGETQTLLTQLGQEVISLRAEARQEAAHARSWSAQTQAHHVALLQKHVHDAAGLTQQQMGQHTQLMMDVQSQLGGLAQAAQHMQALGQDIASLQDILRAPKLRGNLGEVFLEEMLRQVLPLGMYEMQYRLPGKDKNSYVIVDAIIRLGQRWVPIDSKFPLASFERLLETACPEDERRKRRKVFLNVVRQHMDAIATKYIRPDAGTYDFALIYLPAENVYYEAVVRQEDDDPQQSMVGYAAQRKVIPVSPNTLYAYLLTVAYGLKGMHMERQAEAMGSHLLVFQKKFQTFLEHFTKIGRHVDFIHRTYASTLKSTSSLQDSMEKLTDVISDIGAAASSQETQAPPERETMQDTFF